ncbi:hypothetical protein UCDDS831_g00549 [Diplodia seriata]|uniref:Protein kinase domain-containing protein n=1 Tax=Diplodia seriata TaxID=420778 RepID=A0A0G2F157_9PEZI|nr:hypothetical protein UCDDS831_g00549 [Diplodia seriata]
METDGETITQAYESIEKGTMAASSAVETTLLFNLNQADMENAIKDKGVIPEDAQEMLSLRQALLQKDIIYSDLEVPRKDLNIAHRTDRFLLGHHEEQNILVELIKYDQNESTGKPYRATVDQVRRMTALLCHPKRVSFHILPCIGFTHDPLQSTFGLVFEHPPGHDAEKEPVRLSDLYRKKETKTMPLGHRVKLAYALAAALESFHRVGWIHKNFRSDNVVFLEKTKQQQETEVASVVDAPSGVVVASAAAAPAGKLDLAEPWLFGFEYARAEDAGTNLEADFLVENNVYRHPDRWYMPKKKFTKPHDVYSLVRKLPPSSFCHDWFGLKCFAAGSGAFRDCDVE